MTTEYDFVLKFALGNPEEDPEQHLNALFEAGCDDALVGIGRKGSIALDFTRDADSAEEAVGSAIADVMSAIPGAELREVEPDLVNLSDVADMVGCSRQNMRKYAAGEAKSVSTAFPMPVHSGGKEGIWHCFELVKWLSEQTKLKVPASLLEVSLAAAELNLGIQQRRLAAVND